jgi:5-methylcytosine-specific restriction protein B
VGAPEIGKRRLRLHGLNEASEQIVLGVAGQILAAGLVRGDSAFTPGRQVWTKGNAAELVGALDRVLGAGSAGHQPRLLQDHLLQDLRSVSAGSVQLAAELQYLIHLSAADITPETKRERVLALLELLPEDVRLPEEFAQACAAGVFNVGMGFKMQGWRQLRALYGFVQAWTEQKVSVREDASADPWAFKRVVEHAGGARAMRNLLMYLAFPDTFEPIVSQKHKDDIRAAFAAETGGPGDDVDRDLLAIRDHLERQAGTRISFYSDDLMPRWRTGRSTGGTRSIPDVPATAEPRNAWLVRGSSVRGADLVPRWLEEKFCSLPASHLAEAKAGMSREEITRLVEDGYSADSYNERNTKVEEFYNFLTRMSTGDVVTTTRDEQMLLGRITGAPTRQPSPDGPADLVRPVDWAANGAPVEVPDLPPGLRARLRVQQDVVDLTRELPQLAPLLDLAATADERVAEEAEDRAAVPRAVLPRVTPAFARELHLPEPWLQEVVDVLRDRRQLVLYGPPGTGKTHLATQLARHLTRDRQNVTMVQFHPTYSYEDFFEGYRPAQGPGGSVGFQLKPGPFRRLVDRARDDESRPYILIIDELNRANLATVFGELYFLLEYRNEAIDLLYSSGEQGFTMPENVFIIGTMNTADRSVALMDSAMRRRFAFVALHPAEEPVQKLLEQWLEHHGLPLRPARLLAALNERIHDHDRVIGPSYFMRLELYAGDDGGLRDEGLRRVWRTSILPLLEEYHFGSMSPADVAKHYELDSLLAGIDPP